MREYKLKKCKRVHGVHFTPDGARVLAVGGAEARMVDCGVWLDLATGENVGRVEQFANCYAVPPDLGRFALGGASGYTGGIASVQWTETPGPVEWRRFTWPKRNLPPSYPNVHGLAFDPSGTRLALLSARASGRGGTGRLVRRLLLVDRDTGEQLAEFPNAVDAGDTGMMRFSPDGARLAATGGLDGDARVTVFDVAAQRALFTFEPPATVTHAVAFLPDLRVVVANGRNGYVLSPAGDLQFTLEGHPKQVNAVTVTPDGRRLLTASHDGSIRAWDADTGAPGASFDWGIGPVTALAFAPDGLTCAAGRADGHVVVWDVGS